MKRILISLLIIGAIVAAVAGSTLAYFSDTRESVNNTFTTGTLTLQIANAGQPYGNEAQATWVSPGGWAPGETFTATVYLRNTGSVDAKYLGIDWHGLTQPGWDYQAPNGTWLSDKIAVVSLKELVGGNWNDDLGPVQQYQNLVINHEGVLTLRDLAKSYIPSISEPSYTGPDAPKTDEFGGQVHFLNDAITGGGYDITPADTPAIAAGGQYAMQIAFKLMEDTPNDFQGKTCKLNIKFTGAQDMSVFQ